MKKFFALCSMVVALGFVAGCGNGGAPAPAPAPPAPATYNDEATIEGYDYDAETEDAADDDE